MTWAQWLPSLAECLQWAAVAWVLAMWSILEAATHEQV